MKKTNKKTSPIIENFISALGKLPPKKREQFSQKLKPFHDELMRQFAELDNWEREAKALLNNLGPDKTIEEIEEVEAYIQINPPSAGAISILIQLSQNQRKRAVSASGGKTKAANINAKKEQLKKDILEKWAEGNFENPSACAEQEWNSLGFSSYGIAREALRNAPNPCPWPAKVKKSK